ncbi:MAG: glycosyltransferase family 39 protein [Flavobacteriales bacterium]|nr:glycosyltransferase family 39 protein [Flavobacteriales bacterium]
MPPRRDGYLLLALIAFNLVVKLLWLGVNELAHDEPFTVYWSQQPLSAFGEMLRTENNPPLYFLLIKAWSAFVPFKAGWLRVPSAVFSALAVWPLFLLARRLAGVRCALVASLLFTFNNHHYGFAHEVRAYALFTLLATTGMWLLWRSKDKPGKGFHAMLGLVAVNVLLVYTHFLGWLAIGVQALCVLAMPGLRHMRRNFLLGIGITLLWFSPYLVIFISRFGTSVSQGTWLEAPGPEELYNMIWRWSNAPLLAVGFLALILFVAVRSRMEGSAIRLAMIWCMVPLLGMFAVSFIVPIFLDRYLVYAAPGFALLVAVSISDLRAPAAITNALGALAVGGMAFTFTPWQEWRYQPSRVVAQTDAWCPQGCTECIWPPWYRLTFRGAINIEDLKQDHGPFLHFDINRTNVLTRDTVLPTIVVDASGNSSAHDQPWYRLLHASYPAVDSVEADHRVWVYRFRR